MGQTKDLLQKLVNGRELPARLTKKQFNWLMSVADREVESEPFGEVIIREPSRGAQMTGYSDVATIYQIGLSNPVMFKREFNGSGLIYN